jgi:hypothetical protein
MGKNQYCHVCGRKVDLRRDYEISNMPQLNENIKNKQYWFVHRKCYR